MIHWFFVCMYLMCMYLCFYEETNLRPSVYASCMYVCMYVCSVRIKVSSLID